MIDQATRMQRIALVRRRLGLAAIAALAGMAAILIANSLAAAGERRRAEALHVHTFDVLLAAGRLETAANRALRGERGYLLTGDRAFLEPFFSGRAEALRHARDLRRLTRDNPVQQRNLDLVDARLAAYLAEIERLVALQARGRGEEAIRVVRSGQGRRLIEAFLLALHRVDAEERRLLDLRGAAARRADGRDTRYTYVLGGLGALLMLLLIAAILSATRAHRRALDLAVALQHLATTDALTGLPNRRQLMAALETEVRRAARTGRPLALALIDVDHFKRVNDTHGHPAGDEVLRAVAQELRMVTRAGDVLGRFGGEEFAVLMPETSIAQAELACERIRAAIAGRTIVYPDASSGRITVSTGVACLDSEEDCDRLVSRADAALYRAKTDGRNLVRLAA